MKSLVIALSIVIGTLGAAVAQTDPNAPTGPNNPNPPAQFVGQQAPMPCGTAAKDTSAGAGSATAQPQGMQGGQPSNAAKNQPPAAGCAAPDHPAAGSTPAPANMPHQ